MTEAPGKSDLLALIDREQALWEQFLSEVGEERMLEPGASGEWTFKDVVAHLSGWRTNTMTRLDAAEQGHAPAAPPWPSHLNEDDHVEEINAWFYEQNRDRPLQDVLGEYRDTFQRMRDVVTALPERDLTEPGRYPWLDGYPLAAVITSSFGHFHEEHEPMLREWLGRR